MFRRFALPAAFLFLSATAMGQEFSAEARRNEKPDPALEKKAVELLETIADQMENLHAPSNRIRAQATIADLLWSRDEKRARALFKSASDELVASLADLDFSDQDIYQQLSWINQQRQEIVTRTAAHDPDLALACLRATHLPSADPRLRWYTETETNLELRIASLLARNNPERMLELARANLSHGLSYNLINFLNELQQKDPKAAQTLYREIVDRIKSDDLSHDQEAMNVAWNLVSFQPPQADEATYRDLIVALASLAVEINPNDQASITMAESICAQLQSAMPQIEKYAPTRAAELRQWSQTAERTFDPATRMYQEINRVSQSGSVEDILALALKYPGELQLQIYQQAAWKAFSNGDANRARQIVDDFVSDPVQRRQMLQQFEAQRIESAINEDNIAEARQLMSKLKTVDRRVQILVRMAARSAGKGDKKTALELLNEAKKLADSAPQTASQFAAELELARAYAPLDLDQSFAIMQPLVLKINELISAAVALDGFDARYLVSGEWMMPGTNMLGNVVANVDQTLALLASLDFDRARAIAEQLQRPEVRLAIQLNIARAALGGKFVILPGGGGIVSGIMIMN